MVLYQSSWIVATIRFDNVNNYNMDTGQQQKPKIHPHSNNNNKQLRTKIDRQAPKQYVVVFLSFGIIGLDALRLSDLDWWSIIWFGCDIFITAVKTQNYLYTASHKSSGWWRFFWKPGRHKCSSELVFQTETSMNIVYCLHQKYFRYTHYSELKSYSH